MRRSLVAGLLLAVLTTPAIAQQRPLVRLGAGFVVTRPDHDPLWGANAQLEKPLGSIAVYRVLLGVYFGGPASADLPIVTMLGGDVGLRAAHGRLSGSLNAGISLDGSTSGERLLVICPTALPCIRYNLGYNSGVVPAGIGSFDLAFNVLDWLGLFAESRVHVPSGIGHAGYAEDPHAPYVEITAGLQLRK